MKSRSIIKGWVFPAGLILLGVMVISIWLGWSNQVADGPAPITELPERVYYSPAGTWTNFYATRAPETSGWVHLPVVAEAPAFRSQIDPNLRGYVSPAVCAECHAEQAEHFHETAHFLTAMPATHDTILGSFKPGENRLDTHDPNFYFEMVAESDRLFQCARIQENGREYEHRRPFDIVIGSGNHGQTYLYWERDELYQLPVSYFSEVGWINSPGSYRDGTADFARGVGVRCLDCHATYFANEPSSYNRYDKTNFILGVTCVRCHGPGWAHVQYHRTHPEDKTSRYLVHPGELSRERANEVCAQCHSGVGEPLQPSFTYRPGEPLEEYIKLDMNQDDPANDDPHAANQLLRLMKSRCYSESTTLTCVTCHDPHQRERGKLAVFAERCKSCHALDDCGLSAQHGEFLTTRCVECHMPSRRDQEGAMQTSSGTVLPLLRDHLIQRSAEATAAVLSEQTSTQQPEVR